MNQWVPDALADYGLWGLAMGTGFLAGLVFAWFAGYGVVTLIAVILVILLTVAAGIVYFKCKNNEKLFFRGYGKTNTRGYSYDRYTKEEQKERERSYDYVRSILKSILEDSLD